MRETPNQHSERYLSPYESTIEDQEREIDRLKEQLEAAQNALREIASYGDASSRQSGEKDIARRALNPASRLS